MKRIPYVFSDYKDLIENNCYYVDKTSYIEKLERNNNTIIYLRPRRFGKTLFTSMLSYYYDINSKNDYDRLFKDTYIYKHPTNKRNSYYVLKFDFSRLNSAKTEKEIQYKFNLAIKDGLTRFSNYYGLNLKINDKLDASDMLDDFINQLNIECQLYILIDEYDNFTNALLKEDTKTFKKILGKDGFVRDFYASLKFHMSDIVKKIFITGVCSISLDSMTSGFNIGTNITNDITFNSMTALTHKEVKELIKYLNIDENLFKTLEDNYDGYKFNANAKEKVFNPNLVMYFLDKYTKTNNIPNELLDTNIYSDYNQINNITHLFNQNIYENIINEIIEKKSVNGVLKENFFLEGHSNDENYLISLLYYFGYLTIDKNIFGSNSGIIFTIPNKVIEKVFINYFINILDNANIKIDNSRSTPIGLTLNNGKIDELNNYASEIIRLCENNIFKNFNEKSIQLIYFTIMQDITFYNTYNEYFSNGGYADLYLKGKREYTKYDYILEFKYIKKKDFNEDLLNSKIKEAKEQLLKYSKDKRIDKNNLKKYIIIYVGRELKVSLEI